jgi:hypothetical protein
MHLTAHSRGPSKAAGTVGEVVNDRAVDLQRVDGRAVTWGNSGIGPSTW